MMQHVTHPPGIQQLIGDALPIFVLFLTRVMRIGFIKCRNGAG